LPRCPLRNACVRPLGKGQQITIKIKIKIKSQSNGNDNGNGNGNGNGSGKINSFASKPAPTGDDVHLQEAGRLTGRHRSDAATRQASSHKKQSTSALLFTTQQAER